MLLASSLCLAMSIRAPTPRMALDNGGAAIAIRELDVWAGSNNLIESFDWRIMPKERWSLLGPNGCGKSTLLRTIAAAAADATERGELSNTIAVNPRLRMPHRLKPRTSRRHTAVHPYAARCSNPGLQTSRAPAAHTPQRSSASRQVCYSRV